MKLPEIIVNALGCEEYNFVDRVYTAKDPFLEIEQIEQIRSIQFDELSQETIDKVLVLWRDIGDDDDDYSISRLKKEFRAAQFAADNFLEGEWLSDFYSKNKEREV